VGIQVPSQPPWGQLWQIDFNQDDGWDRLRDGCQGLIAVACFLDQEMKVIEVPRAWSPSPLVAICD
jgi:hypothetical protein